MAGQHDASKYYEYLLFNHKKIMVGNTIRHGRYYALMGVTEWETNYPKGARREGFNQTEEERKVTLKYTKRSKQVLLEMAKQERAVDNLRVLYLTVEAMQMNEKRGIAEVMESAYLQLAAPPQKKSPYEVLGIMPNAPLEVAEAVYKTKVKTAHPDAGGSTEAMKELNEAIDEIRKSQ